MEHLEKKGSKIKFTLYGSCQRHFFLLPKETDVRHSALRNVVLRAQQALMASQLTQQIGSISFNAFYSPMNAEARGCIFCSGGINLIRSFNMR